MSHPCQRMRPRAGALALSLALAAQFEGAAAGASTGASTGLALLDNPPLYPDQSEDLGSITRAEATHTEKFVDKEVKKLTVDAVTTDVSGMDCDQLQEHLRGLVRNFERYQTLSFWKRFEATKLNSMKADREKDEITDPKKVTAAYEDSQKESDVAHSLYMESLRLVEILGLRCGATDGYCLHYGKDLIDSYKELQTSKAEAEALMVEAGWLKAEAQMFGASPATKETAGDRKDAAWRKASAVWDLEQRMASGIMIKAAACGMRPPKGPWGDSKNACNLKPEDPFMQALLKEDPLEFIRRWREEIAKQIGISPLYVKVDVSACFPLAVAPTAEPAPSLL